MLVYCKLIKRKGMSSIWERSVKRKAADVCVIKYDLKDKDYIALLHNIRQKTQSKHKTKKDQRI